MSVSPSPLIAQGQSVEYPGKATERLVFLDVLRGMTVAFMILVNNNGSERLAWWPLKHADCAQALEHAHRRP